MRRKHKAGYEMKTTIAGNVIDVCKFYTARLAKIAGIKPREKEYGPTKPAQKLINQKNSIKTLEYLILENFHKDDIRLDLTFSGIEPTAEVAKKEIDKFLRKLRKLYRSNDSELKWIGVFEYEGHRIHFHLLINNIGLTRKDYQAIWKHGKINHKCFQYYDGGPDDAHNIANYFVKETNHTFYKDDAIQKHRWRSSRNLRRPKVTIEKIESKRWREEPKAKTGYYIMKVDNTPDYNGNPHQFYRMVKDENYETTQTERKRNVHCKSKPKEAGGHPQRRRKCRTDSQRE